MNNIVLMLGIWSCFYTLGAFIGPALGGLLFEHLGYMTTVVCFASMMSMMISTDFIELFVDICKSKHEMVDEETQHILKK